MALTLFHIVVFPGFLFLLIYGLVVEFRGQKTVCPVSEPQRTAVVSAPGRSCKTDEQGIGHFPRKRINRWFKSFAYRGVIGCRDSFYVRSPSGVRKSLLPFNGDIIVILYLLTIPTLTFFLAGWNSSSMFATLGAVRTLTQLFAYEVPLFMAILGPALLANTWSLSGITAFYASNPLLAVVNIPGFVAAIIAMPGQIGACAV